MAKSLDQLRIENELLIRKHKARQSLINLSMRRKLEAKRLRIENAILRNPKSTATKKTAKKLAVKGGRLLLKGSVLLAKFLEKQTRPEPMKIKRKIKKRRRIKRKRKK